jgi:hypothetical protein
MKKKDWIILRMILLAYKCDRYTALNSRDYAESLQHLLRKYGSGQVMDALRALREERAV